MIDFKLLEDSYQSTLARIFLFCIKELDFQLGVKKIFSILKGAKGNFFIKHRLFELKSYGALKTLNKNQLQNIFDELCIKGLIEITTLEHSFQRPVISITKEGLNFLNGKKKIDFNFIESLQDKTINLVDIEDIPLYENLVKLRRDLSYKFEIPSFFICNDFTLREIVNKKAVTKEEFLSIKGIGNDFIEKWYEYFESKLNNG